MLATAQLCGRVQEWFSRPDFCRDPGIYYYILRPAVSPGELITREETQAWCSIDFKI